MNTLVLITSHFPFGTSESFLDSEFPFLSKNFDKIIIISQDTTEQKTRKLPEEIIIYRYNPTTSFWGFIRRPFLTALNCKLIISLLRGEIEFRKITGTPLSFKNSFYLFKKSIKAIQLRDYIQEILFKESIAENIVFYSYWLKTGAHAIALLKFQMSIKISRAHGSDLYEEKTGSGYLPFLNFSAQNLNAVFFISVDGKDYFSSKVKMESPTFIVSRLGINKDESDNREQSKSQNFVIASCSNMVPLKRIDLIISALAKVQADKIIHWIHFGDGVLRAGIEELAAKKLGNLTRVKYSFMGQYPNTELLKYYSQNNVDLFLNTSSTEGVPVSIMEAQSFGIPVIATDNGGVRELVIEGTGALIPVDFLPEDLAKKIQDFMNMSDEDKNKIRMNAFNNWKLNFNATSNYKDFISKVNSILASGTEQTQPL